MLYWNEIINDLAKYLHGFVVHVFKLKMFYVWAFCHTTDINTIVQTDLSISSSTLATAVVMRCFSSFKLTGSEGNENSVLYATTQIVCPLR